MGPNSLTKGLILLATVHRVSSATYSLSSSLTGQTFIDAFTWETNADPNWGRVNYVDLATAQSKGLVSVSGNQVTLRADSTTILGSTGPGRDSFNLVSKVVLSSCGTWPAVCALPAHFAVIMYRCAHSIDYTGELGPNWPNGGEIDILEGINNQSPDLITLHTSAGCTMPSNREMNGTSKGTNCNVYQTDNTSCGVSVNAANSYGPSFNSAGGGLYAIERTSSSIKIFFWSRESASIPEDVASPGSTIDTENWGTPTAYFPSSTSCNFATHLSPFSIVIDLDFCTWVFPDRQAQAWRIDILTDPPTLYRRRVGWQFPTLQRGWMSVDLCWSVFVHARKLTISTFLNFTFNTLTIYE